MTSYEIETTIKAQVKHFALKEFCQGQGMIMLLTALSTLKPKIVEILNSPLSQLIP